MTWKLVISFDVIQNQYPSLSLNEDAILSLPLNPNLIFNALPSIFYAFMPMPSHIKALADEFPQTLES